MSGAGVVAGFPDIPPDARADEGHRLAVGPAARSASPITDAQGSKAEDWPPRDAGSHPPVTRGRVVPEVGRSGQDLNICRDTATSTRVGGRDMGKSGTAARVKGFGCRPDASVRPGIGGPASE